MASTLGGIDLSNLLSAVKQGTSELMGAFRPETSNPALGGLGQTGGGADLWAGLSYGGNPALGGLGGGGDNPALAGLGNTGGWATGSGSGVDLGAAIGNNPLWQGAENARNAWSFGKQEEERKQREIATQQRGTTQASGGQYGNHEQYRAYIQQYAIANGIDPDALAAILQIEVPSGDPRATSGAGARGLGQIMPQTWAGLADPGDDPYNAEHSIKNAAKYYAGLYKQFGDYGVAAAAYQSGPGNIVNGKPRSDISDGNMTPQQYADLWTRNYQGIKASAPKAGAVGNWGTAIQKAQSLTGMGYTQQGIRVTGNVADGVDCSSLTGWSFGLKRDLWNAQAQADASQRVAYADMQPGDLLFFQNTVPPGSDPSARPVSHVGIYLGGGRMTHAGSNGVETVSLDSAYWREKYYASGRITPAMVGQ